MDTNKAPWVQRRNERITSSQQDHSDGTSSFVQLRWRAALTAPQSVGSSLQIWLWAPLAKHSSRHIEEMIERIEHLYSLRVHERMVDFRQVADLWRRAANGALATHSDWALLYQELLASLGAILAEPSAGDAKICEHLHSLLTEYRARRPASRAELVRGRLIDVVRPVRSLLSALVRLPWAATDNHPVLQALRRLQDLYAHE